jgi:hypothetical protein
VTFLLPENGSKIAAYEAMIKAAFFFVMYKLENLKGDKK